MAAGNSKNLMPTEVKEEEMESDTESVGSTDSQPPPLRLYSINVGQWDDPKVANRQCGQCGKVGNLTCFSASFRKWALRRATEEELKQHCSRCGEFGHNCLSCFMPMTDEWVRFPKPQPTKAAPAGPIKSPRKTRKPPHCSECGAAGHNRRSCIIGKNDGLKKEIHSALMVNKWQMPGIHELGLSFLQQRNGTCHLDILLESSNVLLPASEEDSESRFLTLQWQNQKSSGVIPTGCILKNEVQKDRSKLSKFKAKKIVKNARRTHLLIKKARRKRLSGQSSRSLAVKRSIVLSAWRKRLPGQSSKLSAVDQGKEIIDLEESTGPEGSIDLGESTKADSLPHQAGLEVEQVANLESRDLVSAN